jgi:hypothetical protein
MCKLIVIIAVFWRLFPINQEDSIIIILDDCKEWRIAQNGLNDERDFIYSKEFPENVSANLDHTRYSAEPEIKSLIISEIKKEKFYFSSQLDFQDWFDLNKMKGKKLFVMMAEDFCSRKRFEYGYSFPLYEVRLSLSLQE